MSEASPNGTTFVLTHGAWLGAWCWGPLKQQLEDIHGYPCETPSLPVGDSRADFIDYANSVSAAVNDRKYGLDDVVLVGHSRAANIVPRVAVSNSAVKKLVYLCASFNEDTFEPTTFPGASLLPAKYHNDFEARIFDIGDELSVFNDGSGGQVRQTFFQDCPDTPEGIAAWATNRLSPQRLPTNVPSPIVDWPKVPMEYIHCTRDQIINPVYSEAVAREVFGVEPIQFDGDHCPFLSQPEKLAKLLVSMAQSN